jgi:hypothetical protein
MLDLASDIVARATRLLFTDRDEAALWTISVAGRVVGSLVCEAGTWRLSWFNGADSRLVAYAGPLDGNIEALAVTLGLRLGFPVRLESLPT